MITEFLALNPKVCSFKYQHELTNNDVKNKKVLNKFYSYLITTIYQGNLDILILYIGIIIEKTLIIFDLSDFWRLIIFLLDLIYLKN